MDFPRTNKYFTLSSNNSPGRSLCCNDLWKLFHFLFLFFRLFFTFWWIIKKYMGDLKNGLILCWCVTLSIYDHFLLYLVITVSRVGLYYLYCHIFKFLWDWSRIKLVLFLITKTYCNENNFFKSVFAWNFS